MLSRNRDEVEMAIAELASEWKKRVDAANEIQQEDSAAASFLRLVVAAFDTYIQFVNMTRQVRLS
jgi:hypothetical protein